MKDQTHIKTILIYSLKIELIMLLLVWISSYIQLSLLSYEDLERAKGLCIILAIGILMDMYSLSLAIYYAIRQESGSLFPGVGWILYFLFSLLYGKPLFINFTSNDILIVSLIRVFEFFLLTCFHILLIVIEDYIMRFTRRS